jgi:hypothetical protein
VYSEGYRPGVTPEAMPVLIKGANEFSYFILFVLAEDDPLVYLEDEFSYYNVPTTPLVPNLDNLAKG